MKTIVRPLPVYLSDSEIERNIAAALAEDVGDGDLTAQLVPADLIARATVISRENAVLCGSAWFERCFAKLDATIAITWRAHDGDGLTPNQTVCEIEGPARSMLTGERTALNFLQVLSGVATKAHHYAEAVAGTHAQVVDTRKTLPGLRLAQKYAVLCGSGGNQNSQLAASFRNLTHNSGRCGNGVGGLQAFMLKVVSDVNCVLLLAVSGVSQELTGSVELQYVTSSQRGSGR